MEHYIEHENTARLDNFIEKLLNLIQNEGKNNGWYPEIMNISSPESFVQLVMYGAELVNHKTVVLIDIWGLSLESVPLPQERKA